jgi:hypothetical protein
MVVNFWICAVGLSLSEFISVLTPRTSVASFDVDAVTELILLSVALN